MISTALYPTPLGDVLLAGEDDSLTGLWFVGQKHFPKGLEPAARGEDLPVFRQTAAWLDVYFSGKAPDFTPTICLSGTPFQLRVWALLRTIRYGQRVTYGQLADRLTKEQGAGRVSARAVGGAVGRNPVSILVPCHRVVGADGSLTGYAGGIARKTALLRLEGITI